MKRLVVCCDGTWQKLTSPCPTNVIKIAQAVKAVGSDGVQQIAYYSEGIGTANPIDKILGGAMGKGIDQNIEDAYRFLCLNYVPGDEIYLFGFSRGAYTVRSLAGMIYNSGLLSRLNICKAPVAYEKYRSYLKPDHPEMVKFRQDFGVEDPQYKDDPEFKKRVPITLLGCWDTVGALGVPDLSASLTLDQRLNEKYKFHDTCLSPIILNALHAVAIDEHRKLFDATLMKKSDRSETQVLRQVWFPGDHGCVGGGTKAYLGLSDGALKWMMDSIQELGLGLDLDEESVLSEDDCIPHGVHPDYTIDFSLGTQGFIERFTLRVGRKIRELSDDFEDIHESAKFRWQKRWDYRPSNLAAKHATKLP